MSKRAVSIDGFNIIERLGVGARTTIYLAKDISTNQTVALKRAVLESDQDHRILEQIETEYKMARQLDHPYIRKCYRLIKKGFFVRKSDFFTGVATMASTTSCLDRSLKISIIRLIPS